MIERLDALENNLVHIIAKFAPWTAPLPTAYLVWEKTVQHFRWPWWVGLLAAIPIEALGLVTVKLALDLYAYNRARRKTDPAAPLWLAVALVAGYLLVALLLTLGLHVAPLIASGQGTTLADWSLAVFPVLSLVAMGAIGLRTDHAQRLLNIAQATAERKRQRAERKRERALQAQNERATAESEYTDDRSQVDLLVCDQCHRVFSFPSEYGGEYTNQRAAQNAMNAHHCRGNNGHEHEPLAELERV